MKDYNLTIQICSPWIVEKIDYMSKYNSVLFVDYCERVKDIFYSFQTDKDFNRFRFNLYTACQEYVRIKKYHDGFRLESDQIEITPHCLAVCLPREIKNRYFKRDNFYEKYIPREFNFHYL